MSKNPLRLGAILILLLALIGTVWGYVVATRDPIVRQARIELADWPAGAPPLTAMLISDIHVIGPDMPPERVGRIVDRINSLKPDLVLIAGDFVSDRAIATRHYSAVEATSVLSRLHPSFGTFAVLGNHDHWRNGGEVRRALRKAGIVVLSNQARQVGPVALGGLDDSFTRHAKVDRTLLSMRRLYGARILLSHSPDPFMKLPQDVPLMLAGHTHCGQVSLPFLGAPMTASAYGRRLACGLVRERGKTLIVTAGLGASNLPVRIGAAPDMWLLTLSGRGTSSRPRH